MNWRNPLYLITTIFAIILHLLYFNPSKSINRQPIIKKYEKIEQLYNWQYSVYYIV